MYFRKSSLYFILSLAVSFLTVQVKAAPDSIKTDTNTLHVGIAGSEPFIVEYDSNDYSGIALEIWQAIAAQSGWHFKTQYFQSVTDALVALKSKKLDVVVGPTSITAERARQVEFSQPYFQSSLSIMSRSDSPTIWERIEPFFSVHLLIAVLIFLFILGCVGTLLWLAERERSPEQFPPDPAHGIANGMWLAIVTMSTTGYGDRAPITFWGRVIAGSWMVISIIFATSMVAGIASTLTLSGLGNDTISKAGQLSNKRVAVLEASPGSAFATEYHAVPVMIENFEEAYHKLKKNNVDAIVVDDPQMVYFLKHNQDAKVIISISQYTK